MHRQAPRLMQSDEYRRGRSAGIEAVPIRCGGFGFRHGRAPRRPRCRGPSHQARSDPPPGSGDPIIGSSPRVVLVSCGRPVREMVPDTIFSVRQGGRYRASSDRRCHGSPAGPSGISRSPAGSERGRYCASPKMGVLRDAECRRGLRSSGCGARRRDRTRPSAGGGGRGRRVHDDVLGNPEACQRLVEGNRALVARQTARDHDEQVDVAGRLPSPRTLDPNKRTVSGSATERIRRTASSQNASSICAVIIQDAPSPASEGIASGHTDSCGRICLHPCLVFAPVVRAAFPPVCRTHLLSPA